MGVRRRGVFLAGALVAALGACSAGGDAGGGSDGGGGNAAKVVIKMFQFVPSPVALKAGESVTWTNNDEAKHTVTSGIPETRSGLFDLPLEGKGSAGSFTFIAAGTTTYFCTIHQSMRGEVHVT